MAQFLASNQMLGLALCATMLAFGWWQRGLFGEMLATPERGWRIVAWAACGFTITLLLWFTFADDWRKVFGELLDVREQYLSQRAVPMPVDPDLRRISFLILIPALLLGGALFARYIGGYGLQFVLVILGFSSFFPLYLIRQRLDTGLAGVLELPDFFSLAMLAIIVYLLLDYTMNIALILTSYLGLLGLAALPVTLLLDLLGRRESTIGPTDEAQRFYAQIHTNLEEQRAALPEQPGEHDTTARR